MARSAAAMRRPYHAPERSRTAAPRRRDTTSAAAAVIGDDDDGGGRGCGMSAGGKGLAGRWSTEGDDGPGAQDAARNLG